MAKTKTLTGLKRIDKKLLLAIAVLLAASGLYLVFGASAGSRWVLISSAPAQDPSPNDGCGEPVLDHTPAEQQYELKVKSIRAIEAKSTASRCRDLFAEPSVQVNLPYFDYELGKYRVCYFLRNVSSSGDSSVHVVIKKTDGNSQYGLPTGKVTISKRDIYDARCSREFLLTAGGAISVNMWPQSGTTRVADIWLERDVGIENNNWLKSTDPSVGL